MNNDNPIDILKIFGLASSVEHHSLECKTAKTDLPKNLWDTYSAFANTDGGTILLGIHEEPKNVFSVTGVDNPSEMVNAFLAACSCVTNVNLNILDNSDVSIITDITGKKVVVINVPEAQANQKPIFIKGNLQMTFIRQGESDKKASKEELDALIRNSQTIVDSILLPDFNILDLDETSITAFKTIISSRYPEKEYEKKTNEELLIELGFFGINRRTQKFCPKQGCLLFFGKYNSITDVFPSYHLDYFDYRNSTSRWSDRVATDTPNIREMNIFNFFNIVYDKLLASDTNSFELDEKQMRVEHSLIIALREALVNMLAHADYRIPGSMLKVEVHNDYYLFHNPGKMLVSIQDFERGGNSVCRNEIIMKAFRYLGYSERQGGGGKEIISVALKNKLMTPSITTNLMYTNLCFWKVDAASFPDLKNDEQQVLRFILNNVVPVSKTEIIEKFPKYTSYRIRTILSTLMKKDRITSVGKAKATKYMINPTRAEFRWSIQKVLNQLNEMI